MSKIKAQWDRYILNLKNDLGQINKEELKGLLLIVLGLCVLFFLPEAYGAKLPGSDESSKLEAAGTLLRILDTALFVWGSRLMAGAAILGGAWNLKEQRYGMAFVSVISGILIATAPKWVKNLFDIGGGSIFS
jgi:uncharacterized protein YjeT (DUF2065 family)